MGMDGAQVVILANTGTEASPNFQVVAEQTGLTDENSRNLIEETSKDNDHTKWLYGKADGTMSVEGMYVPDDAALDALRDARKNAEKVLVRRQEEGSEVEECTCLVESIEEDWPDNDSSTYSIELQKNEEWQAI